MFFYANPGSTGCCDETRRPHRSKDARTKQIKKITTWGYFSTFWRVRLLVQRNVISFASCANAGATSLITSLPASRRKTSTLVLCATAGKARARPRNTNHCVGFFHLVAASSNEVCRRETTLKVVVTRRVLVGFHGLREHTQRRSEFPDDYKIFQKSPRVLTSELQLA
jgi:hypothetical protein